MCFVTSFQLEVGVSCRCPLLTVCTEAAKYLSRKLNVNFIYASKMSVTVGSKKTTAMKQTIN